MILDRVVFIEGFPKSFTLGDGTLLDFYIMKARSLKIQDSLLIVSAEDDDGFWAFFSLPEHEDLGKYIMKGRGPNEFVYSPLTDRQYFYKEAGERFATIYDHDRGVAYKINIGETLRDRRLSIKPVGFPVPRGMFDFVTLNDSTFLCRGLSDDRRQQPRYLLQNGRRKSTENLDKLNLARIRHNEDHNILNSWIQTNHDGRRIVEASMDLNYINLYSLDDSFGVTICIGRKLDNISRIQDIAPEDRVIRYKHLKAYPDFFAALDINELLHRELIKGPRDCVIQFFDWDGNPLAELKLNHHVSSFDIDFANGYLYTLNYITEEIYRHDFREVLDELLK